jgi:hypothetical protein
LKLGCYPYFNIFCNADGAANTSPDPAFSGRGARLLSISGTPIFVLVQVFWIFLAVANFASIVTDMEKVRWGFIGAGYIARIALYPALLNSEVGEIYAVGSKD